MNAKGILLSLIPWIVFSVVGRMIGPETIGFAAAAALAAALALLIRNLPDGLKVIDVTGVVSFGVLTLTAFAGGPGVRELVADYGRGGSALVLGFVLALSVVTVPFTEQYARQSVPRQYWGSPTFRTVNREISALWAGVILATALSHLLDGYLASVNASGQSPRLIDLILNWGVPVALVLLGVHLTKRAVPANHPDVQKAGTR